MSHHMVIFENRDGHPGYNQFDSVEAAVSFVEDLRNNQGIDKFQIFELNEVKFELKTYYRVQLQALNAGAPTRPAQPSAPSPGTAAAQPKAAPAPAPAAAPAAAPVEDKPAAAAPAPAPAAEAKPASAGAPVPPADQPQDDDQPARRGLFGR
ncbi:MAG: hypothetical protein V9F03_15840 [Microthrixaceae bacterium]